MDGIRCLCEEHDLILDVLDRLEVALVKVHTKEEYRREEFQPFIEFLRGFAAGTHFSKEEHGLFPLLHGRGVPCEGSPMAALVQEHEYARGLVLDFAADVERLASDAPTPGARLLRSGGQLIDFLRKHIARGEHCAFGMAARLLHNADPSEVEQSFGAAELRVADPATRERWRALARELAHGHSSTTDERMG